MRTRDQAKYERVVKAAISMVNELGFAGISISKIAKQASVSPATIYIYFENKEDLFSKLYRDIRNEMSQVALQGLQADMTIEQEFKSIWNNFFAFSLEHPQYLAYRERFEQTAMMKKISGNEFELFHHIGDLFHRGIKESEIKDLPLPVLISFAFIPIITLLKFHFEGTIVMDERQINEASEIAWSAVERY
ncbi:MAG: TetR/AcrR family transcriptional regulator [Candidatus Odinarchaeota archaeon]